MNEVISDLNGNRLSLIQVFQLVTLFFFVAALLIIIFIFTSRLVKRAVANEEERLRALFAEYLNTLVILDSSSQMPDASFQFYVSELRAIAKTSRRARQVIVEQLVAMSKNLTGATFRSLQRLFVALRLDHYCERKLKSLSTRRKATGIRELTDLYMTDSLPRIQPFLQSRNKILRDEALMATLRLGKNDPLAFLSHYKGAITPWLRINIHHHLSKTNNQQLPEFSRWFDSQNTDVILLAVSLARQFRQVKAIAALRRLLLHPNDRVAVEAIRTLGELEAYDAAGDVTQVSERFWKHEKGSVAIVRAMARIGQTEQQVSLLQQYLNHPSYEVQSEAVTALMNMGDDGKKKMEAINSHESGRFDRMMAHATEPLLR